MATNVQFAGPADSSIVNPAQSKMTLQGNYLDIQNDGWAKQYLPELYEKEVERYGNRTIAGFLAMAGAEMPMQSDQVIWSEQGRLHLAYNGTIDVTNGEITAIKNIDAPNVTEAHVVRKNATVVAVVEGVVFKALVKVGAETATDTLTIAPYGAENVNDLAGTSATGSKAIKFFVYGSEFQKGTDTMVESIEPQFKTFTNKPMIIKDHFAINGSDTAQIGWVEVSGESGENGYLWYLKASGDTRARFEDYLEMTMVEAEKVAKSGTATADSQLHDLAGNNIEGSEGLLQAIGNRGMVATNQFDNQSGSQTNAESLDEFDLLLKELDKQGAIEENMLYLNRDANLFIDDFLAGLSAGTQGGTAYGIFNNSEDMALNLGFTGFRRGSYDFYKTDWKYLNDASTRGHVGGLSGVLLPAGSSSVYDQQLAQNVRRPFLHVRYRASQADDRKMKTWITGSVGGPTSNSIDKMEIHYLSERCLVVQAANNFIRFDS
jgi:hypothetical protein